MIFSKALPFDFASSEASTALSKVSITSLRRSFAKAKLFFQVSGDFTEFFRFQSLILLQVKASKASTEASPNSSVCSNTPVKGTLLRQFHGKSSTPCLS